MIEYLAARGPYLLFVVLVMCGVYMLVARRSYLKMVVGLYLFQSAIILFFILIAARRDGTVPILGDENGMQANPLPHALMLTAIVVGVATLGVALAILRRMHSEAGGIRDTEIRDTAENRHAADNRGGAENRVSETSLEHEAS